MALLVSLAAAAVFAIGVWALMGFLLKDVPDQDRWDRFELNSRRDEVRQAAKDRL